MCTVIMRKSCAVGMRNAILRNYLKEHENECATIGKRDKIRNFGGEKQTLP